MEASMRKPKEVQDILFIKARDAIRARLSEVAEECTPRVYGLPSNRSELVPNRTSINIGVLKISEPGDKGRPVCQRQFLPHGEPKNILKNRSDNLHAMFIASILGHPAPEHRLLERDAREKATTLVRQVLQSERHTHNHPHRRPLDLDLPGSSADVERSPGSESDDGQECDVRSSAELCALLIWLKVEPQSKMWHKFIQLVASGLVCDCMMPFEDSGSAFDGLFVEPGRSHDEAYRQQWLFCPKRLRQDSLTGQVLEGHEVQHRRLPITEYHFINDGHYGRVYKVKVKGGQFKENKDHYYAMKSVDLTSKDWSIATRIFRNNTKNGGITEILASLTISKNTAFLFMDLALGDLRSLMSSHKGPRDSKQQRHVIMCMVEVAEALAFLQDELHNERGFQTMCLHLDFKPENVLVFADARKADEADLEQVKFRISDFGISKVFNARGTGPSKWDSYAAFEAFSMGSSLQAGNGVDCSPPDAHLPAQEIARPQCLKFWDVWSYGCVLSLLLHWLLKPQDGIENLKTALVQSKGQHDSDTDRFYTKTRITRNEHLSTDLLLWEVGDELVVCRLKLELAESLGQLTNGERWVWQRQQQLRDMFHDLNALLVDEVLIPNWERRITMDQLSKKLRQAHARSDPNILTPPGVAARAATLNTGEELLSFEQSGRSPSSASIPVFVTTRTQSAVREVEPRRRAAAHPQQLASTQASRSNVVEASCANTECLSPMSMSNYSETSGSRTSLRTGLPASSSSQISNSMSSVSTEERPQSGSSRPRVSAHTAQSAGLISVSSSAPRPVVLAKPKPAAKDDRNGSISRISYRPSSQSNAVSFSICADNRPLHGFPVLSMDGQFVACLHQDHLHIHELHLSGRVSRHHSGPVYLTCQDLICWKSCSFGASFLCALAQCKATDSQDKLCFFSLADVRHTKAEYELRPFSSIEVPAGYVLQHVKVLDVKDMVWIACLARNDESQLEVWAFQLEFEGDSHSITLNEDQNLSLRHSVQGDQYDFGNLMFTYDATFLIWTMAMKQGPRQTQARSTGTTVRQPEIFTFCWKVEDDPATRSDVDCYGHNNKGHNDVKSKPVTSVSYHGNNLLVILSHKEIVISLDLKEKRQLKEDWIDGRHVTALCTGANGKLYLFAKSSWKGRISVSRLFDVDVLRKPSEDIVWKTGSRTHKLLFDDFYKLATILALPDAEPGTTGTTQFLLAGENGQLEVIDVGK